jgi:glycyl-tRNA synthetase beta chain
VIGSYYATAEGVDPEVAAAVREHYLPRSAGDALPATATGLTVALADRLDTLAGIFAIGQKPSGTRDPFALRRAAIGVLRMALDRALPLDLMAYISRALELQPVLNPAAATELYEYVCERQRGLYLESGAAGISTEMFSAVLAAAPSSPSDCAHRLQALAGFLLLPEAASLTAANKRIANILKKSASGGTASVDSTLFRLPQEQSLATALEAAEPATAGALDRHDYGTALASLAGLKAAVDAFFDAVLVNDPDTALRDNRLALLGRIRNLFTRIADLSLLPG